MKFPSTIPRTFYQRHPKKVARDLLGCFIVRNYHGELLVGKIVETEAYLSTPDDPASHGYKPQSPRTHSLFGEAGHAYVTNVHKYMIMNVVTESHNQPSAVLIRALEPIEGIKTMKELRDKENIIELTNGPGKLALALGITRELDGIDVTDFQSEVYFLERNQEFNESIITTERIGISKAQDLLLRFYMKNNPWVSGSKKNNLI